MKNNRLLQSAAVAAFFLLIFAGPESARGGDVPQGHPTQTPLLPPHGHQKIESLDDAFAGLDLSKEQEAEVQKIHQDAEQRKAKILKNQSLDPDQRNAMILGCIRIEYSQIFRALTPDQQRVVRERIRALQAEQAPNPKPNAPRN